MRTLRGRVSGVANHAPGSGAVFRKSHGAAVLLIWASVAWVAPAAAQNALPVFANSTETRSFRETPPDSLETRARPLGAPVVATDADGHTLTYSLQGTHASAFAIDGTTGQISTKTGRSYRITDRNRYSVTVKATDSEGGEATVPVTIVVIELVAPEVRGRPEVSGARRSGRWSYRSTIRVTLTFSEAVDVDTSGGRPTMVVRLGGFTSRVRSARYLSGSGTTELVFGYTMARNDGRHSTIHVQQNSLRLSGATIRSSASGLPADLRHLRKTAQGGSAPRAAAWARLWAVPQSHDGTTAFTVRLIFSGTPTGLSPATDAASVLLLTGGRVTSARQTPGGTSSSWEVTVTPDGMGDVAIQLPARPCSETHAVCIGGQPLRAAVVASVRGPEITGSFFQWKSEHNGSRRFELHFEFSHEPRRFSYRTVRDALFDIEGGQIVKARRLKRGRNLRWGIYVVPTGVGDVTLTARATTDCTAAHAVCDAAGRKFGGGVSLTIHGPPSLTVADATVEEAAGATLHFVVKLNRPLTERVLVNYATANGTARAGSDYTAASGRLIFREHETQKTVSVPVLNDSHDETSEAMTLTLSNPRPSRVRLADATATGTITNTDAMPQAWLARFGRSVADQALAAVEGRMRAARQPNAEVNLAGERLGLGPQPGAVAGAPSWIAGDPAVGSGLEQGFATPTGTRDTIRTMAGRELLLGSSFSLAAETTGEGFLSLWGRGAVTRFEGREGTMTLDGEVASALFGTDWSRGRWTTGLLVSHSLGEGGYRDGAGDGTVSATATGIWPWLRHALSERLEIWGMAGFGEGGLTLEPGGGPALRTDLDLWMAATGLRGTLLEGGKEGPTLTGKTDAMIVSTSTDAVSGSPSGNLAAAEGEVTRLRLGLEGAMPVVPAPDWVVTPDFEIGIRHDGGDAETGFGADIGAGLTAANPRRGLSAEFRGRGLLTHEAEGFRERSLSGSISWDPVSGDRGPKLSLTQTFGGASSGGAEALLGRATPAGLAGNDAGGLDSRRLDAKFGYGLTAFGDRFTWIPEGGIGLSDTGRSYSAGWRLVNDGSGAVDGASFDLSIEVRRHESADDDTPPEHEVDFRLTARY